jgi:hypothetical protein
MKVSPLLVVAAAVLAAALAPAAADQAAPLSALAKMPIKEVTIFKDGHAFVAHAGKMPVNDAGRVDMDYLPTPVLGTYWPYSAEKSAKLKAVVASQRKVLVERTALDLRSLIEANIGQEAIITEVPPGRETVTTNYPATILDVPTRGSAELEATAPPGSGEQLPQKGNVVLLKTPDGVKALDFSRILQVTFKGQPKARAVNEEFRNLLSLQLEWSGKPAKEAEVGMFYLQRGLRWIPSYKVTIDGKGSAVVKLEASVINELADLENVTAHLVVGVPTFAMQNTIDPIALQQTMANLSQYMRPDGGSQQLLNYSNAIMSQVASNTAGRYMAREAAARPADLGPEVSGGGQNEDLFIFTVKNLTLKKGQRLVLPVNEVTLKYRDVYTLTVPFSPPSEVWRNFNSQQQSEIAKLTARPRAMHQLRLTNGTEGPLTTAPALIIRDDKVLGQGLMTFTSKGGDVDLPITAAIDIKVKKSDVETKRTPNAETWNGHQYHRIDLAGKLTLDNYTGKDVEIEVRRFVLGNVTGASNDGKIEAINMFEDPDFLPIDGTGGGEWRNWWGWYSWPSWWHRFNSIGKMSWTVKLAPGKSAELTYTWNYYWQ